jgi:hypothetical protein
LLINTPCQNNIKSQSPLRVRLPNGDTIDSTHTSSLDIPEFIQAEYIAHVFPGMANKYLLSVGHLFNEVFYVTFRIDGATIYNSTDKAILKGQSTCAIKKHSTSFLWPIMFMNYITQEL